MYFRVLFLLIFYTFSILTGVYGNDKSLVLKDKNAIEWFKEAKFGMFIHWGLYSVLAGSYNGKTMPDASLPNGNSWYAEWIKARFDIPQKEYVKLTGEFNPILFNAESWVEEAKNAGMKYIVITSKHHDGFALWNSDVSDYDIMQTPFKHDILSDLVKACKKYNIKYGFYYSHWQDWEHEGGALPGWEPKRSDEDFEKYWQEKCLPQVKELLVKYDPDLLWFDTWNEPTHITPERRDELIRLIRGISDKCLINGRISFFNPGENIDYLEMNDNSYPKEMLDKPWQTPATMQHSWGYHAKDYNWKSSKEMIKYLIHNASKGGNYLLNIGPKGDGSIPLPAVRRLREIGTWMLVNGESIYNTEPSGLEVEQDLFMTKKVTEANVFYYVFLTNLCENVVLPLDSISSCCVLESGEPLKFKVQNGKIIISIPKRLFGGGEIPVLKILL